MKAIEDALCDKNGYNVRYLGENGKYYYPSDIASVLPLDKGKQINERDFCYQIRKDKEELERKIESMHFVLLISVWRNSYRFFHQGV